MAWSGFGENCLQNTLFKERRNRRSYDEVDGGRYLTALWKPVDTRNSKWKHNITLAGRLDWKDAVKFSRDGLRNARNFRSKYCLTLQTGCT
jgi:hypothetical protein